MSLFHELRRRNVLRVGAAYAVAAWLIVQVAETLFPLFGFDETPARIVVIVLAIGFVPIMVFAWAFELTPEGLKRDRDIDRSRSITHETGKRLDRIIMLVLSLALAYFAFDQFVLDPSHEASMQARKAEEVEAARLAGRSEALAESYGNKSIAVLAFRDMSPGQDQAYLAEGIAQELLNLLAGIPELRVISRSSAFSFRDQNLEIPEIARRLDVAHILEGSVRQAGNRVRISAQLVDARADTQLWSQTYDRTLDDIFAIQDEIATRVVGQLKAELLGPLPETPHISPEAYSLYLQARHFSDRTTAPDLAEAERLYRETLQLAPAFAPAWNGLAVTYFRMKEPQLSAEESFTRSREAAERALAIDPDLANAHAHLAWLTMFQQNDLAAAAALLQKAIDLAPNDPWILGRAAALLFNLGQLDAAIALGDFEIARDPLHVPAHWNQGLRYLAAHRWEESLAAFRTALRLNRELDTAHFWIGQGLLFGGDAAAAYASTLEIRTEAIRLQGLAMVQFALGENEQSDRAIRELVEHHATGWTAEIAAVFAYRGENDRAFEWLQRTKAEQVPGWHELLLFPWFDGLHHDGRWLPLLESVDRAPEQLAAIDFEVTLPRPGRAAPHSP